MIYTPTTQLYGVIGNPVKHSASPRLFNTIFQAHDYDGVYLGFKNSSLEKIIEAMKSLSITGYSVTIPFKEEVLHYLDDLDETARRLNCANTVFNHNNRLVGYNFDGKGALAGLENFTSRHPKLDWQKAHIIFLGNGGAARGILLTLVTEPNFKGRITVVARNLSKTEKLFDNAHSLNSNFKNLTAQPWENRHNPEIKGSGLVVVINTTSLGMSPQIEGSPLSKELCKGFWSEEMIAYDIVYNPLKTRFLRQAEETGAHTITGLNMFLGQARLQLLTWTGINLTLEAMHSYFAKASQSA